MSFEDLVYKSADRVVRRHVNVLEIRKGGKWDPGKHPRDKAGRFIEKGGTARVTLSGGTDIEAKVTAVNDDGSIELQIGRSKIRRQSSEIEMVSGRGGKDLKEPDPPRPTGAARTELKALQRDLEKQPGYSPEDENSPAASLKRIIDGKGTQGDAVSIATVLDSIETSPHTTEFSHQLKDFAGGTSAEPQADGSVTPTGPGDSQVGAQGGTLAGLRAQSRLSRPADTIAAPSGGSGDGAGNDPAVQELWQIANGENNTDALDALTSLKQALNDGQADAAESALQQIEAAVTVPEETAAKVRTIISQLKKSDTADPIVIDVDRLDEIVTTHLPERWRTTLTS